MRSTNETDSGSYVNGVYTTKNGFSGLGLNCPKGTRLYNTNLTQPIFFVPEDRGETEEFRRITNDVAQDIMPYYAISNYGRVLNTYSGKIMKPNYRPNGYEYYCLSAENSKTGQKKYSTHRMVMKTFEPIDNSDNLQVNHINGIKSDNYINKTMPDGTMESNLEWVTPKENNEHARQNMNFTSKLSDDDAKIIRDLRSKGYTYEYIKNNYFDNASTTAIQNVCLNKTYKDENYTPIKAKQALEINPLLVHRLSENDISIIHKLNEEGYNAKEIQQIFYNNFSYSTILNIVNNS